MGIVRPIEFRGTATRYPRKEFLRLLGVIWMRRDGIRRLSEIRRRLDALSDPDLEAWIATLGVVPEVAAAFGLSGPNAPRAHASTATPSDGNAVRGAAAEVWQHIRLLPGLELVVKADASPAVRGIAQAIYDEYVGAPPAEPGTLQR